MNRILFIIPFLVILSSSFVFSQENIEDPAYQFMQKNLPRLVKKQDQLVPKISRYYPIKEFFLDDLLSFGPEFPAEIGPELNKANQDYLLKQFCYWSQQTSLNPLKLGIPLDQLRDTEALTIDAQLDLIKSKATLHVFFPPLFTLDGKYAFFYHIQSSGETGMLIYRKAQDNNWEQCYYYQMFKS